MAFKLFYTDYTADKHVRSDEAESATKEEIIECMNRLLHEPDNFVGLIDGKDVMLQFMVEDSGEVCVDVPLHDRKGSFMKASNIGECIDIVTALEANIELEEISGLEFKSWGR